MKLTKEQINSIRHVVTCDDLHLTECASEELRRLALLGLEREGRASRVAAFIEAEKEYGRSVLADSFGAFPDLEPDDEPKRDDRAERVGRAVIESGFNVSDAEAVRTIYSWAGNGASRIVECMSAIADAMEEP